MLPKKVKDTATRTTREQKKSLSEPLWQGPSAEGPNGGITYSMLCRFLNCRERFRVCYLEGLRSADEFSARMEFGNLWHFCEEHDDWDEGLKVYAHMLADKYPTEKEQIRTQFLVVQMMYGEYKEYWKRDKDTKDRKVLLAEEVFDVPYTLPSGRMVRLRGKWDSVDLIGKGVWLQENKTKGDINEGQITQQLSNDLQTMIYLTALYLHKPNDPRLFNPVMGVRYNVVRRPRHHQGKKETQPEFIERLRGIIQEEPEHFFMRWKVEIGQDQVTRFRQRTLDPILEQLCDWHEFVTIAVNPFVPTPGDPVVHWQHPYGVYNVLDEGGSTDLDNYLETGSTVGLVRADSLFKELQ